MTLTEYLEPFKGKRVLRPQVETSLRGNHQRAVAQALVEGKPVPAEVLKDYPDLARAAKVNPQMLMVESTLMKFLDACNKPLRKPTKEQIRRWRRWGHDLWGNITEEDRNRAWRKGIVI